ncbi:hypothetical protein, partial [Streptomyces sp. NPDC060198]|uniref:hypothetical protein n=1 Tax=Streptomyces sp. NPDC060198 TaxID=3347070 RepID=UPI003651A40F
MDGPGGAVPWHVLEGVPSGREETPKLLDGLLKAGERRISWTRLRERVGTGWTGHPLFAPTAARLLEPLPELDVRHRRQVLAGTACGHAGQARRTPRTRGGRQPDRGPRYPVPAVGRAGERWA